MHETYRDVMAGKPDSDDVPTLITTDEEAAVDQLPTSAKTRRRQRRRRQKKQSLRPGDVRQRMTVSDDVTVVVDEAADTSSSLNCSYRCGHLTRGEDSRDAASETSTQTSRQNSCTGRVEFEVPSELKCSVTLLTFGEWVQVVKDNPHMIYYVDDVSRSPLVPNSILQRPVTRTVATQTTTQTAEDEHVTRSNDTDDDDNAQMSELNLQYVMQRLRELEIEDRGQPEEQHTEVQWHITAYNHWAMYGDDCVVIFKDNPFTKSPLEMRYDVDIQKRIHGILTKLYTRDHLLNSIGDEQKVEQLYKTAEREGSRKEGWERLMKLPPETPVASVHEIVMKKVEFDMTMHDKYLGGAYDQSFLSCPDELWAIYLRTYESVSLNDRWSRESDS